MPHLYNTLTRKKEEFVPFREGHVGMYHCGPTVYDDIHIGNFRSYVFADIVRRVFEYNDYRVKQIINITDVGHLTSDADEGEDKMTKGLKREGLEISREGMSKLGAKYAAAFGRDSKYLNIKKPSSLPRASEHIAEQIELIRRLEKKGFIYTTSDGVYFDTAQKKDYGKLSRAEMGSRQAGARVAVNEEKRNPEDFAVWKFNEELGWESPWGKGFPGWHIECSAMSMKYLGEHFDIHTGGIDHIPVHHENEIAQSEAVTGEAFVNYWMHHGHVLIGHEKMAKSEGNIITITTLKEKGFSPLSYRYWLLTADYKKTVNFTWGALEAADEALASLYDAFLRFKKEQPLWRAILPARPHSEYVREFSEYINDDLNMPQAVALVWKLVKDSSVSPAQKYATLLDFDKVLGLQFAEQKPLEVPKEVERLVKRREEARAEHDWEAADSLRAEIGSHGYYVDDTAGGSRITRKG